MANTYTSINIHYVFSTKNRANLIVGNLRERLWAFMGGIARENRMKARSIGGIEDHVHLLVSMPSTLSIAKGIQLIKGWGVGMGSRYIFRDAKFRLAGGVWRFQCQRIQPCRDDCLY
jgi:REP element-mobilizing transposase RayT